MQYKKLSDEIKGMKCVKLYKPILILAYLDYIELSQNKKYTINYLVDLNSLMPFISYYLSQDNVKASGMSASNLEYKYLYKTIITGPLYRIEKECFAFNAIEKEGIEYFGFSNQLISNESVDVKRLTTTARKACLELLSVYVNNFNSLDLKPYIPILQEIRTTKIAPGSPAKIYKYILILSLLDYFLAIDSNVDPFNEVVSVDELITYYKLNLSDDLFGSVIENKKIVNGSNLVIKNHIQTMPLRKLCKPDSYFKNDDKNPKSRTKEDLPTTFEIYCPKELNSKIVQTMIRETCYELIKYHTGDAVEKSIIKKINESTDYESSSTARKGQKEYRESLIERYRCTCALCNLDFTPILIASHAKPWRDCTNTHEKLSQNNGLLLCSFHDDLFDKGYISFDPANEYKILFSTQITGNVLNTFETSYQNKVPLFVANNPKMEKYLQYHREHIFKQ